MMHNNASNDNCLKVWTLQLDSISKWAIYISFTNYVFLRVFSIWLRL